MNMADEYRDIFDVNRSPTGRLQKRGTPIQDGDFITGVACWILNSTGEFLITRRALDLAWAPGMWGVPGGAVLSGEDSLTAAIREANEETGITLDPNCAEMFVTCIIDHVFIDHWLFRQEFDLSALVLQVEETIDARAAAYAEITQMIEQGEFIRDDDPALNDFLKAVSQ